MPRPALPACTSSPREGVVAAVQGPGLCRQNSCKGPRGATAHPIGRACHSCAAASGCFCRWGHGLGSERMLGACLARSVATE